MLDASSTRCVKSWVRHWYSVSQEAVHHYQEGSFPHQIASILKTAELIATPPRAMIHLFCHVSELHHRASRVLGVCEGYECVGDVSEDGLLCTMSNCLPLPLPFLLFLPVYVLLLDLSCAPPPGIQQCFTLCPVLPQFLQELASVLPVRMPC